MKEYTWTAAAILLRMRPFSLLAIKIRLVTFIIFLSFLQRTPKTSFFFLEIYSRRVNTYLFENERMVTDYRWGRQLATFALVSFCPNDI